MKINIESYYKLILLTVMFIVNTIHNIYSQYLENPSFEGPVVENSPPSGWWGCTRFSTPDTQPGVVDIDIPASEGETYLSMRVRGEIHSAQYEDWVDTRENCQTKLIKPLQKDICYKMEVDLARDPEVVLFGLTVDTRPVKFRVWGSEFYCDTSELLAETGPIENLNWERFTFTLTPTINDYDFLYIEPYYAGDETYHGIILVDNISIYESLLGEPKLMLDTTIMPGEQITLHASESPSYNWLPQEGLSCTDCNAPIITANHPQIYYVTLQDSNKCYYKELFVVSVIDCEERGRQLSGIKMDTVVTPPARISLNASKSISYNWDPTDGLSCTNCRNPVADIENRQVYRCLLYDEYQCIYEEIFNIRVELIIPNVITPNGDGYNDRFVIQGLSDNSSLKIFDRYGKLVYENDNYQNDWDGSDLNNQSLPANTYWFRFLDAYSGVEYNDFIFLKR